MATSDQDDTSKKLENVEDKKTAHKFHDKMFFGTLRNHNIARDALQAYLPKELLSQLDLSRLKPYKTKLVSPQMKEFQADILYEIPFKETAALVLFHCEQESKPKRTISLKVWQYLFLVLMEYAENYPNEPLPIPFPLVIYTGEVKFNYSTYLFDLFGAYKNLAETYFLQGITLVDICRLDDEDIKKRTLFGLSEYAFKHKKGKSFRKFLETIIPWLDRVELQIGVDYAKMYIQYIIEVFPEGNYAFFTKMAKQLSKELEKEAMTIAQQLKNEGMQQGIQKGMQQGIQKGRQEGMQQGIQKGIQEGIQQGIQKGMQQGIQEGMQQGKIIEKEGIAKKMLISKKFSNEVIASITDLAIDEIERIRKELNIN